MSKKDKKYKSGKVEIRVRDFDKEAELRRKKNETNKNTKGNYKGKAYGNFTEYLPGKERSNKKQKSNRPKARLDKKKTNFIIIDDVKKTDFVIVDLKPSRDHITKAEFALSYLHDSPILAKSIAYEFDKIFSKLANIVETSKIESEQFSTLINKLNFKKLRSFLKGIKSDDVRILEAMRYVINEDSIAQNIDESNPNDPMNVASVILNGEGEFSSKFFKSFLSTEIDRACNKVMDRIQDPGDDYDETIIIEDKGEDNMNKVSSQEVELLVELVKRAVRDQVQMENLLDMDDPENKELVDFLERVMEENIKSFVESVEKQNIQTHEEMMELANSTISVLVQQLMSGINHKLKEKQQDNVSNLDEKTQDMLDLAKEKLNEISAEYQDDFVPMTDYEYYKSEGMTDEEIREYLEFKKEFSKDTLKYDEIVSKVEAGEMECEKVTLLERIKMGLFWK